MMTREQNNKRILLWGDTGAGKTTLMTSALCDDPSRFPEVDWQASAAKIGSFSEYWARLRRNLLVQPTITDFSEVELCLRSGDRLTIIDHKGNLTEPIPNERVQAEQERADAFLFVVDGTGENMPKQFNAIETAWNQTGRRPTAVALTKFEQGLGIYDPAWEAKPGWWKGIQVLQSETRILGRFDGGAVWPVSAYGYNTQTAAPAVILGEFGQLIPYQIMPKNVVEPLRWLMSKINLV